MRSLSASALAKVAQATGTEPICVVTISWTNYTTISYADRAVAGIPGKILKVSELDEVIKLENRGVTASITVTLDDTDSSLLALLGSIDIHRRPCTVRQHFEGMDPSDMFVLFYGWVASPIAWDEGERTLTFDILSKVLSTEVGFTPEDGQLPNLMPDLVGKAWPLGFGSCVNVPAVKSGETRIGFVGTQFGFPDITLANKISLLSARLSQYGVTWQTYSDFIVAAQQIARTPFLIREDFVGDLISQSDLKQQREDAASQLEALDRQVQGLKEIVFEAVTPSDFEDAVATMQAASDGRDEVASTLRDLTAQLSDVEVDKKVLGIEGANREYAYKVIQTVIDKMTALATSYWDGLRLLEQMVAALFYQQQLVKGTIRVGNGRFFPQGTPTQVVINGFVFTGTFSGDSMSVGARAARYANLSVSGSDQSRPDVFYLSDPTANLKGMYCLLPTGYIVRVVEQQGTECQIELVEVQKPTGMEPGDKPKPPPADVDLSPGTWAELTNAGVQEYTAKEQKQMVDQAVGKTTQGQQLQKVSKSIQAMIDLVPQAVTESDAKDLSDAIYNSMDYFNAVTSELRVPDDIEAKAQEVVSKGDFDLLLRLQNLEKLEEKRDETPIGTQPPPYYRRWYVTGSQVTHVVEAAPSPLPDWLPKLNREQFRNLPETSPWVCNIGTAVVEAADYQNKYVANIVPSTVAAVSAFRVVDGFRVLVPVPQSYYTKDENEPMGVVQDGILLGLDTTTVSLRRPLTEYPGQGWEDQIYVSYSSSVGPNVVDVLQWLIATYTDITVDAASFAACRALEASYPVGFALLQQKEVMQCLEEISWQARLRMVVRANVAYLIYLPQEPSPVATITEDDVLEKTLSVSTTDTENLVTELRCKYTPDYAYADRDYYVALRYNFTKYGRVKKDYDFYIYGDQSLVSKSGTFWMIRLANSFKVVKFKCPLTKLAIETGDIITLDFARPWVANGPVLAEVTKAQFNSEDYAVDVECWTPVRLGEMTPYHFFWPSGIAEEDNFPTVLDIDGGNAGNPIGQYVPSGQGYDFDTSAGRLDPEAIKLRPQSYGDRNPSDAGDAIPPNPLDGMAEFDYLPSSPSTSFGNPTPRTMSTEVPNYAGVPRVVTPGTRGQTGTTVFSPAPGQGGSGMVMGTVLYPSSDDRFSLPLTDDELQELADLGDGQYPQVYSVLLESGQTIKARQRTINTRSLISTGTSTPVSYDAVHQVYTMQVPVWTSPVPGTDSSSPGPTNANSPGNTSTEP